MMEDTRGQWPQHWGSLPPGAAFPLLLPWAVPAVVRLITSHRPQQMSSFLLLQSLLDGRHVLDIYDKVWRSLKSDSGTYKVGVVSMLITQVRKPQLRNQMTSLKLHGQ